MLFVQQYKEFRLASKITFFCLKGRPKNLVSKWTKIHTACNVAATYSSLLFLGFARQRTELLWNSHDQYNCCSDQSWFSDLNVRHWRWSLNPDSAYSLDLLKSPFFWKENMRWILPVKLGCKMVQCTTGCMPKTIYLSRKWAILWYSLGNKSLFHFPTKEEKLLGFFGWIFYIAPLSVA